MEQLIQSILKRHASLFGPHPKAEKVNIGFTNTIYSIDDSFIVKICTDRDNEAQFQKEIDFYRANGGLSFLPKFYASNTDKAQFPYFYEIMEKAAGVPLYSLWHTLSEPQRETIICQLCSAMKQLHSRKGEPYDWTGALKAQFAALSAKAEELALFSREEQALLTLAYGKWEEYLPSTDFVLVHNDLHFDNILFHNGSITLIDFERSLHAPRDFELDILYRMIRKPWKFAGEEAEVYTDGKDYANIMSYIGKFYPELVNIPNLSQRLYIYDTIYFLRQLIEYPNAEDLKHDVLFAAEKVAL